MPADRHKCESFQPKKGHICAEEEQIAWKGATSLGPQTPRGGVSTSTPTRNGKGGGVSKGGGRGGEGGGMGWRGGARALNVAVVGGSRGGGGDWGQCGGGSSSTSGMAIGGSDDGRIRLPPPPVYVKKGSPLARSSCNVACALFLAGCAASRAGASNSSR